MPGTDPAVYIGVLGMDSVLVSAGQMTIKGDQKEQFLHLY
jgi:hypothetical protein